MQQLVTVAGTGFHDLIALTQQLPDKAGLTLGDEIVLEFTPGQFVFLTGLNLLATWRKSLPAGVSARVDDSKCVLATQSFLTNSGFREIIETGHETPAAQPRSGRMPLRPLTSRLSKEATVSEATSVLEGEFESSTDMRPFATLLSELCENALTHSEFASPGYVCARVIQNDGTLELAVCDSGIGFRASYFSGTNEEAKARIEKGANPIEVAIEGLNSSKPTRAPGSSLSYYGFGLYLTRRLVEENHGRMILLSGRDGLQINGSSRTHRDLKVPFPGTYVAIVLNLHQPLPLEKIYEQATELYVGPQKASQKISSSATRNVDSGVEISANNSVSGEAAVELKHFGTELLTRETGLAIRAEIATLLLKFETVTVKLDGISDLTPSVADEAFAKLADALGHDVFNLAIRFEGGTTLVNRLIEFVLKTRLGHKR